MNKIQDFIEKNNLSPYLLGLADILFFWGLYFFFIFPRMIYWNKDGLMAGWVNVWSDWATHFAFASRFAYCPPQDWFTAHPFYYAQSFRHHWGANLITGLLIKAGWTEIQAFIIPSIITAILLLIVLYGFYSYVLKSPAQAKTAITLFLASGGLGFIWFIKDFLASPKLETLLFPPHECTNLPEKGISCINIITSELIPQRAILIGIPLALIFIIFILLWSEKNFEGISNLKLLALGLILGFMPIFHYFSFCVVILFSFIQMLFKRKCFKKWIFFYLGLACSIYLIKNTLFSGNVSKEFFRWYPGWMSNKESYNLNFLYFWLINWGLFFPLTIISIWKTKYYKHPLIITGILIFTLSNLFLFSTWNWNNYKLVTWSQLFFCIPVSTYLGMLWNKNKKEIRIAVIAMIFLMTISGLIDLYRLTKTDKLSHMLWSYNEFDLAREFIAISKPNSRVLTAPLHNHWVMSLTGRQIIMGYEGRLWSWGIPYGNTKEDVKKMFTGSSEAEELLAKYKVDYVVIGPSEIEKSHANEEFFSTRFKKVLDIGNNRVYSVNERL